MNGMPCDDATVLRLPYVAGEGPCRGRNEALRRSRSAWVFLVDADVEPRPDCLERLLAAVSGRPDAVAATPRIMTREPGLIEYDAGACHFLGELCLENAGVAVDRAVGPSLRPSSASSAALLVRREAALSCGLFDESLVIFKDDLDFMLRLAAMGGTLIHVPEALAEHRPPPRRPAGDLRERKLFFQARNRWRVLLKVASWRLLALTLPLQLAYEALNLGRAVLSGRTLQHARALLDVATDLPRIMRLRRTFQALKLVPDARLFGAPPLSWSAETLSWGGARLLARALDALSGTWWRCVKRYLSRAS